MTTEGELLSVLFPVEESSASHPFGRLEDARCRNAGLRGGRSGKEVGAEARSASALLESGGGEGGAKRRAVLQEPGRLGVGGWWLGGSLKRSRRADIKSYHLKDTMWLKTQ